MRRRGRMLMCLVGCLAWSTGGHAQEAPAAAPVEAAAPEAAASAGPGLAEMDAQAMSDERARSHFTVGQSLYRAGRFAEAGREWEQAYELSGRVLLLYNVYIAYRDAGERREAIRALELYLDKGEVSDDERLTLSARLEVMKNQQAEQQAIEAAAAQASAGSEPKPEPAAPVEAEAGGSIAPWILIGTGGAMVIAGIATGVVTNAKKGDVDDACEDTGICPPGFDLEGKRSQVKTLALVTDVLLIGGGVAVATGVVLGLLLDGKPESRTVQSGALNCTGRGCMATVYGQF